MDYSKTGLEGFLDSGEFKRAAVAAGGFEVGEYGEDAFEVDISHWPEERKVLYNQYVLIAFARMAGRLFGLDPVAVTFVSQGRYYGDGNFGNIIGDFHDYVPVLFNFHPKDAGEIGSDGPSGDERILKEYLEYMAFIKKENLNFLAYLAAREGEGVRLEEWASPFIFNSIIGLYENIKGDGKSEVGETSQLPAGSAEGETAAPIFSLTMVREPGSDSLWLEFKQNSTFDNEEVKARFKESFPK